VCGFWLGWGADWEVWWWLDGYLEGGGGYRFGDVEECRLDELIGRFW
jgi:hypothetical protein